MSVNPNLTNETERYASFDAMRLVHADLLRRYRQAGESEEQLATIKQFLQKGKITGAWLDDEDDRSAAQGLLDYWGALLYRNGWDVPEILLDEFDESLAPELEDALCPYRGLNAFKEEDGAIFFGRQKSIDEMLAHLRNHRLLVVVGPSGCGKSSIVRAGLIPALKNNALPSSAEWLCFQVMVPGSNPLESLERLLRSVSPQTSVVQDTLSAAIAMLGNPQDVVKRMTKLCENRTMLLVVDQFEEIFTLCEDTAVRQAFTLILKALVENPDCQHRIILTMRTDFEARLPLLPELHPLIDKNLLRVTPLNAAELRQAIEEPARRIGLKFDDGVVDHLLTDILGESAALPLLQFTLLKLWENRDRNRITWEAYRRLGGGRQALANSADEFYRDLIPEEQITARRILLRMVRPGEGLEVTSRRVRKRELYTRSEAADRIERVLEKFLQARLLRLTEGKTKDDDQIEVAHEALVRNWPALVGWLEDEREQIRERQRLTAAAERWNTLERDVGALLRGALLDEAKRMQSSDENLSPLEEAYIQASQDAVTAEQAAEEASRQRELEAARRLADTERRAAQRLRWRNRIISYVGILAFLAAAVAVVQWFSALANASAALDAKAIAVDARATAVMANSLNEGLRFQAETAEVDALRQKSVAEQAATQAVSERRAQETASAMQETASALAESQRSTAVALVTQVMVQKQVAVAEKARADQSDTLARARQLNELSLSLAFRQLDLGLLLSLEAARLAPSFSAQGSLMQVMQANPNLHAYLRQGDNSVISLAFSPDGNRLASLGQDGVVWIWDPVTGAPISSIDTGVTMAEQIAFIPGNRTFAVGGCNKLDRTGSCLDQGGMVSFWNIDKPEKAVDIRRSFQLANGDWEGHRDAVYRMAFHPEGTLMATADRLGAVVFWYTPLVRNASPRRLSQYLQHSSVIQSILFSPDGSWLVSGGEDGRINRREVDLRKVLNAETLPPDSTFARIDDPILSLAFSPDGSVLAVGDGKGQISLWDWERQILLGVPFPAHSLGVTSLAFSPDGKRLVSSSFDGQVIVWELEGFWASGKLNGPPPATYLNGHTDAVFSAAFSPEQRWIASGGAGNTIILWHSNEYYPLSILVSVEDSGVNALSFSSDGKNLEASLQEKKLLTWDVQQIMSSADGIIAPISSLDYNPKTVNEFPSASGILGFLVSQSDKQEALGIDVSRWNGQVDWRRVRQDGINFAYLRASGGNQVDASFAANWEAAKRAGILRGAYHTYEAALDPLEQVKVFLSTVELEITDLPPALDLSVNTGKVSADKLLNDVQTWVKEIIAATGRLPVIYTSPYSWDKLVSEFVSPQTQSEQPLTLLNTLPLWVGDWSEGDLPKLPQGWINWTFWQYTDKGNVNGVSGQVDLNRFNGSLDDLILLAEQNQAGQSLVVSRVNLSVFDPVKGRSIGEALPLQPASAAALDDSSRYIAVGDEKGTITFWDLESGKQVGAALSLAGSQINSLSFLDKRYLAAGSDDGLVSLWDISQILSEKMGEPTRITNLYGHTAPVMSLAFSRDGKFLASGSADGGIILWDLEAMEAIGQPFFGPRSAVAALSFHPNGLSLAAGYADGHVVIWNVDLASWSYIACRIANRNLTALEWNRYFPGEEYRQTCP